MSEDTVNHPKHYGGHPSGVDCIDVVEHFNFNRGNAIKYIWRAGKKGDELEDLKKARWYVDREIERLEKPDLWGSAPSWEQADLAPQTEAADRAAKDLAELYEKVRRGHVDYFPAHPGDLRAGDWVRYRLKGSPDSLYTDKLVADGDALRAVTTGHLIRHNGEFFRGVYDVRQIVEDPR